MEKDWKRATDAKREILSVCLKRDSCTSRRRTGRCIGKKCTVSTDCANNPKDECCTSPRHYHCSATEAARTPTGFLARKVDVNDVRLVGPQNLARILISLESKDERHYYCTSYDLRLNPLPILLSTLMPHAEGNRSNQKQHKIQTRKAVCTTKPGSSANDGLKSHPKRRPDD